MVWLEGYLDRAIGQIYRLDFVEEKILPSRIAAIMPLLAAGAWWLALTAVAWNIMQADLLIRLAQLLTLLGVLGIGVAAANMVCAWHAREGRWNRLTSPLLLLALLGTLWFVGNFHLLTLRLHY